MTSPNLSYLQNIELRKGRRILRTLRIRRIEACRRPNRGQSVQVQILAVPPTYILAQTSVDFAFELRQLSKGILITRALEGK